MADVDTVDPSAQATIETPSGVTLTGIGGDVDALRIQFEEREEARTPDAPATPEAPKKVTRGQKRFDALTAEREEAVRRADAAEARAKELEAKLAAPPAASPAQTPATPKVEATPPVETLARTKPTEDEIGTKYANYAAFVEDLADWKAEQREAKLRKDLDAQSTARIEADRATRSRTDHVNTVVFPAGRAAYSDFDAVLQANTTLVPPEYQAAILQMPKAEHVLYALAKDNAKLQHILTITNALQLGAELAQLIPREPVASPASTAPVVRTTNVPAPVQPVGSSTRTTKPTLQELADAGRWDDYKAARAAGQTH